MTQNKLSFATMRTGFFFALIILLALTVLYLVKPFVYPIFWAAVIAVLFYPLYEWINRHIKMPSCSSLITIVLVIVMLLLPLTIIFTLLVNESIQLYHTVSQGTIAHGIERIAEWLNKTSFAPYLEKAKTEWSQYAANVTKTVSVFLFNNLKSITQNSVRFVFMFFIMFYTLFYFFKDGPRFLQKLMHLSPLGNRYETMLYQKFTSATRATLKGSLVVACVQGLLGGLIFWIAGIKTAFLWAVLMAVLAIIPGLGAFLIWVPVGVSMLITGYIWQGVMILVVGALVISLVDNFIRPPLVGKDIQLHPLLVLFSTLGGIFMFGIPGIIIGPIIASLFMAVVSIYNHHYQNELRNN